ncbi:MAG: hypothetical protein DRI44_08370 [Chlamydiae bacterium]|nr:MAG: hypothetical protein DRI44_08370 [Chlamydiota bacterium]
MHPQAHQITSPVPEVKTFIHDATVSFIIGNYNHSDFVNDLLWQILSYVEIPRGWEVEIIISDTGSRQEELDKIAKFVSKTFELWKQRKIKRVLLVLQDLNPLRIQRPTFHGYSFALNAGVRCADHDIIIYCDSSIIIPKNFIEEMTKIHYAETCFLRAGLFNLTKELTEKIRRNRQKYNFDIINEQFLSQLKPSLGRPAWSVKRSLFNQLGGMDEEMIDYGAVDDDFVNRIIMCGYKNYQSPIYVFHQWHPERRDTNNNRNFSILTKHIQKRQTIVNSGKKPQFEEKVFILCR